MQINKAWGQHCGNAMQKHLHGARGQQEPCEPALQQALAPLDHDYTAQGRFKCFLSQSMNVQQAFSNVSQRDAF